MQRKLKEIGNGHYQYVMKIQTEVDETTKQLREQSNALLQTIRALENKKEHLQSVFLDKQLDYCVNCLLLQKPFLYFDNC